MNRRELPRADLSFVTGGHTFVEGDVVSVRSHLENVPVGAQLELFMPLRLGRKP